MAVRLPASLTGVGVAIPSGIGAAVMGTGIVSVALALEGEAAASDVLLAIAGALAVASVPLLLVLAGTDRARFLRGASTPLSLSAVAAMCVLGTRSALAGSRAAGAVLLACATLVWAPLVFCVLRRWRRPARGDGFLLSVSAQAIAVLCAALRVSWLAAAAVVALIAGLALYVFAAASFDGGEIRRGRGDQWVAGGALAIGALAAATASEAMPAAGERHDLATVSLALWALAMAWLPVLIVGELLAPRAGFDQRRWSTVFPVGMYAAMSYAVGHVEGRRAIVGFARDWTWVALALWALVTAATVWHAVRLLA